MWVPVRVPVWVMVSLPFSIDEVVWCWWEKVESLKVFGREGYFLYLAHSHSRATKKKQKRKGSGKKGKKEKRKKGKKEKRRNKKGLLFFIPHCARAALRSPAPHYM